MNTRTLLFFLLVISSFRLSAQTESRNRLDSAGKKHGEWIIYLDRYWKEVKLEKEAVYCRISYYEHGINVYPMGPCGKKNWTLKSTKTDSLQKNNSGLLNGEYKWFDENGKLVSEHLFKNGKYISCKEYSRTGELKQHFDYNKNHRSEPHTYFVYIYEKSGKKTTYVMRNGNYGWMLYQVSESDL